MHVRVYIQKVMDINRLNKVDCFQYAIICDLIKTFRYNNIYLKPILIIIFAVKQ